MKLVVVAVGKLKSGPERALCERYSERLAGMARSIGASAVKTVEIPESNQRRPSDRMSEEAKLILSAVSDRAVIVLFDERGASVSSPEFADILQKYRDKGSDTLAYVIGGPDGLDPDLRKRADVVLCFGQMTVPHQIVRALVYEQLYRAATILTGHPYHRT